MHSPASLPPEPLSANLTYWLEIDANRMRSRGVFGNGQRNTSGTMEISEEKDCNTEMIQISVRSHSVARSGNWLTHWDNSTAALGAGHGGCLYEGSLAQCCNVATSGVGCRDWLDRDPLPGAELQQPLGWSVYTAITLCSELH